MSIRDLTKREGTQIALDESRSELERLDDDTWGQDINEYMRYTLCPRDMTLTEWARKVVLGDINYLSNRLLQFDSGELK